MSLGHFGFIFGLGANVGQCLVWWTLLTDFGLEGYLRAIFGSCGYLGFILGLWSLWVNFRSLLTNFGFRVTLGPLWALRSLWVHFWFGGHFEAKVRARALSIPGRNLRPLKLFGLHFEFF